LEIGFEQQTMAIGCGFVTSDLHFTQQCIKSNGYQISKLFLLINLTKFESCLWYERILEPPHNSIALSWKTLASNGSVADTQDIKGVRKGSGWG